MVYKVLVNHVFAFLLDLPEVNAKFGGCQFGGMKSVSTIIELRGIIYKDLINNPYLKQDDITPEERNSAGNNHNNGHTLVKIPTGGKSMTSFCQIKIKIPL